MRRSEISGGDDVRQKNEEEENKYTENNKTFYILLLYAGDRDNITRRVRMRRGKKNHRYYHIVRARALLLLFEHKLRTLLKPRAYNLHRYYNTTDDRLLFIPLPMYNTTYVQNNGGFLPTSDRYTHTV